MLREYRLMVQTSTPEDKLPRMDGRLAAEIDLHFGAGAAQLFVVLDNDEWSEVEPIDSSH